MKTIELKFNQDLPGYTIVEEVKIIIELINAIDSSSILEAGVFTGKLTWSLCKTFLEKQITALDLFDGKSYVDRIGGRYHTTTRRDERYLNQTNTLEFFNNLQSEHTNLNIIKLNFLLLQQLCQFSTQLFVGQSRRGSSRGRSGSYNSGMRESNRSGAGAQYVGNIRGTGALGLRLDRTNRRDLRA